MFVDFEYWFWCKFLDHRFMRWLVPELLVTAFLALVYFVLYALAHTYLGYTQSGVDHLRTLAIVLPGSRLMAWAMKKVWPPKAKL